MLRHFLRLLILFAMVIAGGVSTLSAQEIPDLPVPDENTVDTGPLPEQVPDTAPKARVNTAWTLVAPLGQHKPAKVDTVLYNYQRIAIPAMYSDAMATTGNLGTQALNMMYFERPAYTSFMFDRSLAIWTPSLATQKFYNVYTPMTILSYNFGGNRENHTDRLSAQFAGNVNRNIGVAAFLDYMYSKGCYEDQASKDFIYGANVYYTGHRYEMQTLFHAFSLLNKENGGITDDLYITDPAVLQGGDDHVESKSIPVNLNNSFTRLTGSRLFSNHAYKIGFWREEVVNDTLTRDIYIPVTKFLYSIDYETRRHRFWNNNPAEGREFFANTYFYDTGADDNTYYWSLSNTLGVELVEGFQKWAKFGLSAYATYQVRRFFQTTDNMDFEALDLENNENLTPLPVDYSVLPKVTQSLLWVGGRLEKTKGSLLRYAADVKVGLVGAAAGQVFANGEIATNFKLFGDTVSIKATAHFSNRNPSYFTKQYVSNHFIWQNKFGQVRTFRVGGQLVIPWTNTTVSANFESNQNHVYFDENALPRQFSGALGIFALRLHQELHFGIWNWNNTITYQASTNNDIQPLPMLTIYSNMYIHFRAFKVLTLQIGIDCDYFTKYRGLMYQPATSVFHVQNKDNAISVGNYPLINAYITAKLYKVRFFILWSHVNQGLFSKNYFSMPHYPIDPRRLQFGLSIDFAN